MVGGGGFEASNPKEKIYSLPFSAYRIGRRVNVYDVNTGEVSYVYLDDDSTPDSLYLAGDRLVVLAVWGTEATDDAPARTTAHGNLTASAKACSSE